MYIYIIYICIYRVYTWYQSGAKSPWCLSPGIERSQEMAMLRSIDALRLQVPPGATREILFSTLADEEFTRSRSCFFLLRILRIPEIDVHIIEYVYHMQPFLDSFASRFHQQTDGILGMVRVVHILSCLDRKR